MIRSKLSGANYEYQTVKRIGSDYVRQDDFSSGAYSSSYQVNTDVFLLLSASTSNRITIIETPFS